MVVGGRFDAREERIEWWEEKFGDREERISGRIADFMVF